jgi:hypothetical protein
VIPLATQLDRIIDRLEEMNREILEVKRRLTMVAPLPPKLKPGLIRGQEVIDPIIAEAYFDTVRAAVQLAEDTPMNFRENVVEPVMRKPAQAKKVRTKAQKKNDKMQSQAFKNANSALRKQNGQMRKGVNQRDIARRAQKELRKLKKSGTKRAKRATSSVRRRLKR